MSESAGDAVLAALDRLAAERSPYLTLGETVGMLGGTRRAATAFGVTQRTVQRWLKETPGQQRRLARSSPAIRAAVAKVQRDQTADALQEQLAEGFSVPYLTAEIRISKDRRMRSPSTVVAVEEPDEATVESLVEAWVRGDGQQAAAAFGQLLFGAWGQGRMDSAILGDTEELVIETGG